MKEIKELNNNNSSLSNSKNSEGLNDVSQSQYHSQSHNSNEIYLFNPDNETNKQKEDEDHYEEQIENNNDFDFNEENKNKNSQNLKILRHLSTNRSEKNSLTNLEKNYSNQVTDLREEIQILTLEFSKIQEALAKKDEIIYEFQILSEMTKSQFQMLEEANFLLSEENKNLLSKFLDENKKLNTMKNQPDLSNREYDINELRKNFENEFFKREENLKKRFEENEKKMKERFKDKEENLKKEFFKEISQFSFGSETTKKENSKLKFEVKNFKSKFEETEIIIKELEIDHKKNILEKENQIEKLKNKIKDLSSQISQFEKKASDKNLETIQKTKSNEEKEKNLFLQILSKEKKSKELEDDSENLKNLITDLECKLKEHEIKCQNKTKMIDDLKSQNEEILSEINNKEIENLMNEELKFKEISLLNSKIEELETKGIFLHRENGELKKKLSSAVGKISELNDTIIDKYERIEKNYFKEKENKEYLEKKLRDVMNKMKENDSRYFRTIANMKIQFDKKSEDIEMIKSQNENRICKMKIRLDEVEFEKNNFADDLKQIKRIQSKEISRIHSRQFSPLYSPDTQRIQHIDHMNIFTKSKKESYEDPQQLKVLENFRNVIDKIDHKITSIPKNSANAHDKKYYSQNVINSMKY